MVVNCVGEIQALAGCDLLTISPGLLAELENCSEPLVQSLSATHGKRLGASIHLTPNPPGVENDNSGFDLVQQPRRLTFQRWR